MNPETCFLAAIAMCYEMFMVAAIKRMRIEVSVMEVKVVGEIAEGKWFPEKLLKKSR